MKRSAPQGVFFMPLGGPGALLMLRELVGRRVDWTVLTVIISVIAAMSGILLGRHGKTKSFKDEVAREGLSLFKGRILMHEHGGMPAIDRSRFKPNVDFRRRILVRCYDGTIVKI